MAWSKAPSYNPSVDNTALTPRVNTAEGNIGSLETKISTVLEPDVNRILGDLSSANRQSTTVSNGVSVISGGVNSLASIEIEGRTLISGSNSNLEAGKQYVLADKKTKVVVDGVTQAGVAKFTKGTTTVSIASFLGKIAGSTVANPHKAKYAAQAPFLTPSQGSDFDQVAYDRMASVGNGLASVAYNGNGTTVTAQTVFSFDIIAEVERKLGIIPKSTLAEKVQWVKDNVELLVANWHGFGSSVGGNKVTIKVWRISTNAWTVEQVVSYSGIVSKVVFGIGDPHNFIDVNGVVHYIVYAEPSDGVITSSMSTDYMDLVVTLKATAQLNTRPTIIRVENFEGKQSGSVVENPHVVKSAYNQTTLQPPTGSWTNGESVTSDYVAFSKLDGVGKTYGTTLINGAMAQILFSFNLIEAIERNVGKIPRTSVADKVQWIKDNTNRFVGKWWGFGSSVGGNKANWSMWKADSSAWLPPISHTLGNVAGMSPWTTSTPSSYVDTNGFIHFLAYAEPSDGVTASTINTDYIDLEIELKPTADFTRPKVALYEVTADSYAKILVDWSADEVVNRYPSVEGVQHLQGVGVVAEGENLLPPFTEWNLHANAKVVNPYEFELVGTAFNTSSVLVDTLPSASYTFSYMQLSGEFVDIYPVDANGAIGTILVGTSGVDSGFQTRVITTNATTKKLRVQFSNKIAGTFRFTNPMLNLGTTAKPFVPRNPSYQYADVKLGAIGSVADRLYEQDGAKFVRKVVEKDVVLGGELGWNFSVDYVGFKRIDLAFTSITQPSNYKTLLTKYNGVTKNGLPTTNELPLNGDNHLLGNVGSMYATLLDSDTGFGEAYVPSTAICKAYFYGWKMNNGVFGTNYDGTGIATWVPIGDISNARAVTVCPTSASPTQLDGTIQPYKLSYVLATPQVVNVTDKVEGSLKVSGTTQVETLSGIVVREKVVPFLTGGVVYFNEVSTGMESCRFKNKVFKILQIYKNGIAEKQYSLNTLRGYGREHAYIMQANYDPTAEYTVTYIALDKHLMTSNPTNVKLTYSNSIRSAVDDLVSRTEDNSTTLSVNARIIVDILARLKAQGL